MKLLRVQCGLEFRALCDIPRARCCIELYGFGILGLGYLVLEASTALRNFSCHICVYIYTYAVSLA